MDKKTAYALSIMFLIICILPASANTKSSTDIKSHKIEVILTPGTHQMKVKDTIKIDAAKKITLYLNKEFKIDVVALNGKEADYIFEKDYNFSSVKIFDDNFAADFKRAGMLTIELEKPGKQIVVIAYTGYAKEAPKASKFSREYVANVTPGYIGNEGTFLSLEYFWYPRSGVKNDMAYLMRERCIRNPGQPNNSFSEQRPRWHSIARFEKVLNYSEFLIWILSEKIRVHSQVFFGFFDVKFRKSLTTFEEICVNFNVVYAVFVDDILPCLQIYAVSRVIVFPLDEQAALICFPL